MSSVARVKFIKTKVIVSYHTKCISNQVSSIRITKSKVIHVQFLVPIWEKKKKWEKVFWVTKWEIRGLQIGAKRLQIGAEISNRDKEIPNRGEDYESRQEGFQNGAEITNRCRTTFT